MDAVVTFLLAALALTGSPGPNTLSLAAVGASFGRVRGLRYMLGLNLGMVLVITIVGTGLAGTLMAIPAVAPVVSLFAAAYFIYLAYKIATAPPLNSNAAETGSSPPKWYAGVGVSLANPKAYAAMAAMFSGHALLPANPVTDALFKAALLVATICVVNIAWLWIGAWMTQYLRDERTSRIVNITFAVLLIASVASVVLAS